MFQRAIPKLRDHGPRPRAGGLPAFTMIEILVVVVILGIASAIIVPQMSSRNDLDAAAAARAVMADLLYAQNRAIAMQKTQYVSFNVADQQYGLYDTMSPQVVLTHPVNLNNYVMTFGQSGANNISNNATLASAGFNGQATIAFDELGEPYSYNAGTITPLSGTGTIVLTSGNYSLTISVAQDTGDISTN